MVVERENETIIIKVDQALIGMDKVQEIINYFSVLESNARNKGTKQDADALARESQIGWWQENRHRFIK